MTDLSERFKDLPLWHPTAAERDAVLRRRAKIEKPGDVQGQPPAPGSKGGAV